MRDELHASAATRFSSQADAERAMARLEEALPHFTAGRPLTKNALKHWVKYGYGDVNPESRTSDRAGVAKKILAASKIRSDGTLLTGSLKFYKTFLELPRGLRVQGTLTLTHCIFAPDNEDIQARCLVIAYPHAGHPEEQDITFPATVTNHLIYLDHTGPGRLPGRVGLDQIRVGGSVILTGINQRRNLPVIDEATGPIIIGRNPIHWDAGHENVTTGYVRPITNPEHAAWENALTQAMPRSAAVSGAVRLPSDLLVVSLQPESRLRELGWSDADIARGPEPITWSPPPAQIRAHDRYAPPTAAREELSSLGSSRLQLQPPHNASPGSTNASARPSRPAGENTESQRCTVVAVHLGLYLLPGNLAPANYADRVDPKVLREGHARLPARKLTQAQRDQLANECCLITLTESASLAHPVYWLSGQVIRVAELADMLRAWMISGTDPMNRQPLRFSDFFRAAED